MEKRKMVGVGVYECLCKKCGFEFDIYRLSDFSYGEKLLLTEDGIDYVYLNCFDDKVFNRIDGIVRELLKDRLLSDIQIRECLNKVFDLTCDTVNEKHINSLRNNPSCPKCKCDDFQ